MPPLPLSPGAAAAAAEHGGVLLRSAPGALLVHQSGLRHCRAVVATVVALGAWYHAGGGPAAARSLPPAEQAATARTRALVEALVRLACATTAGP